MIDQRFLLWPVLFVLLLIVVSWTFNHVSAWAAIFLVVVATVLVNRYFKPKNKE